MTPFEIKEVLDSLIILHDSREQETDRANRRYATFGLPHRRATLDYGDYTYNAILPSGKPIFDESVAVRSKCVIERKMDLAELSQCLIQQKARFEREFQRAADNGARIYLIIEDGTWENIVLGKYRTKVHPNAYIASLVAILVRYNANLILCKAETSGRIIREILYRDLKERLERGDFDE